MKTLDFKPKKSKEDFRKNYKLHDLAEYHGKNLLTQWGIDFHDFGKDKRYEKVWEKGEDKPDIIAELNGKKFLIDWKGKTKEVFWVNKRAIDSYLNWSNKLQIPIIICFFLFDKNFQLTDRRFALVGHHKHEIISDKAWDKNDVVKFNPDLPLFTKTNIKKELL
ncbi:MAG: hypothetical protein H6609_03755 [Ignavibacteriales bacterium]|nr:hypothetical protein [Ignavibacteriales bacterium]